VAALPLDGGRAVADPFRRTVETVELETERALALSSSVADIDAYVADLDGEIEAMRELYVASAVTEITTLRTELSGALAG
jgi:hypothetical protein